MAEASQLYVCRPDDLGALSAHYDAVRAGNSRAVLVEAPLGGGKRALVGEFVRSLPADEDALVIRCQFSDEEDGLRTLLRLYASLYGALYRDAALRGKVEMILNAQLPQHPKRVQGWYQAFVEALKKAVPADGEQQFQVQLPRDNPLIGFAEIVSGIARKMNVVLEVQDASNCHSIAVHAMLELLAERRKQGRLLLVLTSPPIDDVNRGWMPVPFLDTLDRRAGEIHRLPLHPWDGDDVAKFAASKGIAIAFPARVAEIAGGRPGYVAELVDELVSRELQASALDGLSLASLAPRDVDVDELEAPSAPPEEGKRKHAGAEDAARVQFLAALLGQSFPSGLVAEMGGYDRDSVDDLFDACPKLVKELQFSKPLGTWIYQFKEGIFRQGVLDGHAGAEDQEIARRVGTFMERFLVPRGYEYLVKTARLYAEHGAAPRAAIVRAMALGSDRPDTWGMTHDLLQYADEISWPEPMRRSVTMNLLDRLVQVGDVQSTEKLVTEALAWATERDDKPMQAFVCFAGSRLDFRRNDLYRARDRAKDALTLYKGLDDKLKCAEVENHLAMIEYQDGNANAALDHVRQALEIANVPQVQAASEYIRGLIDRKAKKITEAGERFRKANEIAGGLGMGPLALEAGFHYGETLLISNDLAKAADVLARVAQIAQSLQNPVRERAAAALLAQAHGRLRNFEAALNMASRTLQLTQQLKFERFMAVDIYNVGFYNLALGRANEASSLFGKARERAGSDDPRFLKDLHYHSGVAFMRIGEVQSAASAFSSSVAPARQVKDWRKVMEASEQLAGIEVKRGNKGGASRFLQDAIAAADQGNFKEERKGLRRKLEELA